MGKPEAGNTVSSMREFTLTHGRHTRGTETSKYPEEKKATCDSPSSGERKGSSPNAMCVYSLSALHMAGSGRLLVRAAARTRSFDKTPS